MAVVHHVVASLPHPASRPALITGMHMLEWGLLVGVLIGWFPPIWIRVVVAGFSFLVIGGANVVTSHTHAVSQAVPYLLVAVLVVAGAIVVGLTYGRTRTLKQMGASEFQGRLTTLRKISKW